MTDRERLELLSSRFNDDALRRITRAEQAYYSKHGHYLPELATLLLEERALVKQQQDAMHEAHEAWLDWHFADSVTKMRKGRIRFEAAIAALAASGVPGGEPA